MEALHAALSPSMPPDRTSLLDSAVALTRETERAALHAGLLRTLGEMLPLREVRLAPRGELVPGARAVDGGSWHVLPLRGTDAPVGKEVAVHLGSENSEDTSVLNGFLRLYNNFLEVIEESERDRLTQLRNRRAFDARLDCLTSSLVIERRYAKGHDPYWLALIDIDHFKVINDTYGHLYGDEVLVLMARLMREYFAGGQDAYRYGGEEFAVVLSLPTIEAVREMLEGFRAAVEATHFPGVDRVTLSIGFSLVETGKAPPVIIERADRALYEAKGRGRNCVVDFESLVGRDEASGQHPKWGDIEFF